VTSVDAKLTPRTERVGDCHFRCHRLGDGIHLAECPGQVRSKAPPVLLRCPTRLETCLVLREALGRTVASLTNVDRRPSASAARASAVSANGGVEFDNIDNSRPTRTSVGELVQRQLSAPPPRRGLRSRPGLVSLHVSRDGRLASPTQRELRRCVGHERRYRRSFRARTR